MVPLNTIVKLNFSYSKPINGNHSFIVKTIHLLLVIYSNWKVNQPFFGSPTAWETPKQLRNALHSCSRGKPALRPGWYAACYCDSNCGSLSWCLEDPGKHGWDEVSFQGLWCCIQGRAVGVLPGIFFGYKGSLLRWPMIHLSGWWPMIHLSGWPGAVNRFSRVYV